MLHPPLPRWNKLTDDIDYKDYARRVRDFEVSMLPADIVFPRTGQIWEAVRDGDIYFRAWFDGRLPEDGKARLPKGERVCMVTIDDPKPLLVRFEPVRYHELREVLVPDALRNAAGFDHYELYARIARNVCWFDIQYEVDYFNELFRLVDGPA